MKRKGILQIQRYNNSYILDDVLLILSSKCELQRINACRLFLNIIFLLEISSIHGDTYIPCILLKDKSSIPPSTLSWPL